jgi:long-chain acyl-CoA synthetase
VGLNSGERLGVYLPNCLEYELAFYAASKLGAVVCPINPSCREFELEYQLTDAEARVLITHATLWPFVEPLRGRLTGLRVFVIAGPDQTQAVGHVRSFAGLMRASSHDAPTATVGQDEILALPYSSGTSGRPKGVMLTHRNLVCNHIQFAHASRLGPDDVYLVYLPQSHIYGIALMGLAMCSGAQQIILERFDMATVARLVEQHGVTCLHVVPPILLALANAPGLERSQFASVRFALSAAAPLAPDVARRVERRLGFRVIQGYGMTEAAPATHHTPLDADDIVLESVGTPLADTEQRVVDLETGQRTLLPREVGEVVIRGPQVMKGYWNAPEETDRALRNGWLHTGDIGWVDERGCLFLVDRKKEMIKYRSFSIAPAELEALLLEHADVVDCAVVGVPDADAGEVPKAFVVARSGATLDVGALERFVRERLAGYKHIRQWEMISAIPRTPSGKILRRVLRETTACLKNT